jgi:hypothetical protein
MGRDPITFNCVDCGVLVTRVRRGDEPLVCAEHGIARAMAYNDRLHAERLARRDTLRAAGTPRRTAQRAT